MYGFRPNPYMKGIIPGKISAQVPDEMGQFGEQPSSKTVVVLLLGSRSNQYVITTHMHLLHLSFDMFFF